jgi:hypothetical protein
MRRVGKKEVLAYVLESGFFNAKDTADEGNVKRYSLEYELVLLATAESTLYDRPSLPSDWKVTDATQRAVQKELTKMKHDLHVIEKASLA